MTKHAPQAPGFSHGVKGCWWLCHQSTLMIHPHSTMELMSKSTYQSSHNVVYSSKYHLVWCPKYRRQVLRGSVENRLKSVIAEICDEYHAQVIGLEVMPDHVHLLVEVDPSFGVSRLVRLIKGRSSRILRQEFPHLRQLPSLWTNSWFCSTVGGAPLSVIKQYVENQKIA